MEFDAIIKCADIMDKCFVRIMSSYGKERDPHEFRDAFIGGYNEEKLKERKDG